MKVSASATDRQEQNEDLIDQAQGDRDLGAPGGMGGHLIVEKFGIQSHVYKGVKVCAIQGLLCAGEGFYWAAEQIGD